MKLVVVIMIMLLCTIISTIYVKQIKNHTKSVMQFILLIENIKILIEYKNTSISELFYILCSCDSYNLLTFLDEISNGLEDYQKTVCNVFSCNNSKCHFDQEDIEHIKNFFLMLGTSDTNGQIVNCNLYKNIFEKKYSQLYSAEKSKCKCTSTLSIGLGILISIFII